MAKGYSSILQKKLQEAETQLIKLLRLPPQTQLYAQQDIEQRLDFLKTLFSAEKVSSPQNPHHLQHISERLALIESVFREWNESCLDDEDGVVDSELIHEKKEKNIDGDEEKGVRVGGGMKLMATAMAGGFVIGFGVMGFMVPQWCHCFSLCNSTAASFIPT